MTNVVDININQPHWERVVICECGYKQVSVFLDRTTQVECLSCGKMTTVCKTCDGERWVCESHPDQPWNGGDLECCGGAGIPCADCNPCGGRDDPPLDPPGFKPIG